MRPSFHPRLINDPFSDPGLFIPFLFEKRALMFDLGDLGGLSARDLLKVSHVFVTHTHMDHFIGLDTLLRLFLGRNKKLHLFGPPDFFKNVEGKLAGYTWNLVHEYENDFMLEVNEVHQDKVFTRTYLCRERFQPQKDVTSRPFKGSLLMEPAFSVSAVHLDHRLPCLGLALHENFYVNIIKEGLKELNIPVGPWLNHFKKALYEEKNPGDEFLVTWKDSGGTSRKKSFALGELMEKIARVSPGQKIAYVADAIGSAENCAKIIGLAREADLLFIEAAFLHSDLDRARKKYHLTAKEAGEMARKAGVKAYRLFHFSPRYTGREFELEEEARRAFRDD